MTQQVMQSQPYIRTAEWETCSPPLGNLLGLWYNKTTRWGYYQSLRTAHVYRYNDHSHQWEFAR